MGRIETSIEIKASPEKVWEMLAVDRFKEWTVGIASSFLDTKDIKFTSEVSTPEDKYKVGASAQSRGETFKVTESLKNEKITYLIGEETGTNAGTIALVLEPIEEGTKLTYVTDYEMPWGIFGKFIEKFSKRIGERDLGKSLEKLKSILEK